ncbi:adenosine deaminase [Fusibacter paucivorans]|uniref:Adenosine deaminase n=1 Tax=Fusibacter paucivorans TaxID=76009 RepID=A0ABS5PUC7_9FIRM|nr:adenosine deaminase [Fusibacter paucivorans]MBS7528773.1 adenosine deaminase [Fusibacter paucivorans]
MTFSKALADKDYETLRTMPKSDLHNHATRGGNIRDFFDDVDLPKRDFTNLDEMQQWYDANIKYKFSGQEGFIARVESAFKQAQHDGIRRLALSFGIGDSIHFASLEAYFMAIRQLHQTIAPEIDFIPELCLGRTSNIEPVQDMFDEVIEYDFFKSIDLVGDDRDSVANYKSIYRKAKSKGIILKAHLGEFGDAESVRKGVDVLELDEVQHGIAAATSIEVKNWLRTNDVQLNICPSSNVMLNRVPSYEIHPIKELFHHGIKVTINSDDMLIFDQSVTQDYINLFESGCMSANDLNTVRETGLLLR